MILHIHPASPVSVTGTALAGSLSSQSGEPIFKTTDKTPQQWRDIIDNGEQLTLVAPIYWWGLSSDFEIWVQNVFTMGWAFDYTKQPTGMLQGKKMIIHLTHGMPAEYADMMRKNITERLQQGVFGYCGIETEIEFHPVMH
jgi:putative NADPH-quinone reductase